MLLRKHLPCIKYIIVPEMQPSKTEYVCDNKPQISQYVALARRATECSKKLKNHSKQPLDEPTV